MKPDDGDLDTIPSTMHDTAPRSAGGTPLPPVAGYALGEVIGRGGMGEVVHARDLRIDRDVAIKRMRGDAHAEDAVLRFMREAKIQARLDHPAVVPLYELGRDAAGNPYFTMKRLAGVTLEAHVSRGTPLQPLLRAFVDVALAVEYAHARGIVHRDLKPANIMLGDFGEVYVLDWGLARRTDEASDAPVATMTTPLHGVTAIGAILGTPGYMPPEQVRDASSVGCAADVYALGAILFEILAGEPVHPRDDAIASTLGGRVDVSPLRRRPDRAIAPELDALCSAALAEQAQARPTARRLAEQVQNYLDGDRDVALRRTMATGALEDARRHLGNQSRGDAMRSAARALALDPSSTEAAELVTRMMLEPPAVAPPELAAELVAADDARTQMRARTAVGGYTVLLVVSLVAIANGIRDWMIASAIVAVAVALLLFAATASVRRVVTRRELWLYAIANAVTIGLIGRACSPLLIAPSLACVVIASLCAYPALLRHTRVIVPLVMAGWLLPIGLEASGVASPTWGVAGDTLAMQPAVLDVGGLTAFWLVLTNAAIIVVLGLQSATVARANLAFERQIRSQRWHYSQLIPRPRDAQHV